MRGEQVLVVGASGKIGLAIVRALAAEYKLILQCRSGCRKLEGVLRGLPHARGARLIRHDFLAEGVDAFVGKLRSEGLTRFSTAVIASGVYDETPPNMSNDEIVRKVLLTNLGIPARLIEALPYVSRAEDLVILILTDVTPERGPNAYAGLSPSLPYLAASAGVHALIKAAPYRLPRNAYVVGLALGWVEGRHLSEGLKAAIRETVPAGEPVRLEDIVNVVLKVCRRELPVRALNGCVLKLSNGL